MKKRICLLILIALLLLSVVPPVHAAENLCFVAMNDTIPTTLKNNGIPYYTERRLYLPFTAFNASPNGVGASFNKEKNTLVIYNAYETLLFDLEKGTYTDKSQNKYDVEVAFRSGMLYVPETVVSHFGLYVTLLFSQEGHPIIRFTNGDQVYDDGTFVAQAESLITRAVQEYQNELAAQTRPPVIVPEPPPEEIPEPPPVYFAPVEVYLAFAGEAVSAFTLDRLSIHNLRAAFFLTEDQILQERELVRAIFAAGHTVGITCDEEEENIAEGLRRANEALDTVLLFRSAIALVPDTAEIEMPSVRLVREPEAVSVEELLETAGEPQLYVVRKTASSVITALVSADAAILKLRETTF